MAATGDSLQLAIEHQRAGRLAEAAALYRRILRTEPDNPLVLFNLGVVSQLSGNAERALLHIGKAIGVLPAEPQFRLKMAEVLRASGRAGEAIAHLEHALGYQPEMAALHAALGEAQSHAGRFDEALACFRQAGRLNPNDPENHILAAGLFKSREKPADAVVELRKAIELSPNHVLAHHVLGQLLLVQGQFKDGWREFDWRLQGSLREWSGKLNALAPRWDGSPLDGKTILVAWEQGLGDTIQFIRYVPILAAEGARVVVLAQAAVADVISAVPGIERIVLHGQPIPPVDCHITLLSLPYVLSDRIGEDVPCEVPYLKAEESTVANWRERLAAVQGLKVGIAWQGNPDNPADFRRSVPLSQFFLLARMPDVQLVSLQAFHGLEQLENLPGDVNILDFGDSLVGDGDLSHPAGLVAAVDLVISIDSVMVHLAGGLGKPVWVPLMANPCWRWLLEREDSPWYPTVRLFRERRPGDWDDVFNRITTALKAFQQEV